MTLMDIELRRGMKVISGSNPLPWSDLATDSNRLRERERERNIKKEWEIEREKEKERVREREN